MSLSQAATDVAPLCDAICESLSLQGSLLWALAIDMYHERDHVLQVANSWWPSTRSRSTFVRDACLRMPGSSPAAGDGGAFAHVIVTLTITLTRCARTCTSGECDAVRTHGNNL